MSGGVAYVLDEKHDLYRRVNKELVSIELVTKSRDIDELRELIEAHYKATGSVVAARILSDFDGYLPAFKKIMPVGYQRMLRALPTLRSWVKPASRRNWMRFMQTLQTKEGRTWEKQPVSWNMTAR